MKLNSSTITSAIEFTKTFTLGNDKFTPEQQTILLRFLLLFNIFEAGLFDESIKFRRENCDAIHKALKNTNWFKVGTYDEYGKFFVDRYFKNGRYDDNGLFHGQSSEICDQVKNAIEKLKNDERDEKLFDSYLEIAYRFRNKLFHGEKAVQGVVRQIDCLEKINWMLEKLLNDMVSNEFAGLSEEYPKSLRKRDAN